MKKLKFLIYPIIILVLILMRNPKVKAEVDDAKRDIIQTVRKGLAYISGFLTKIVHDEISFTQLEEDRNE